MSYIYEKLIKIIHLKNTNWDESNKIQHDCVFSNVYGEKSSQSYDMNSAYDPNVAIKLGRREYYEIYVVFFISEI